MLRENVGECNFFTACRENLPDYWEIRCRGSMLPALLLDDVDKVQIGRDLEFIFLE